MLPITHPKPETLTVKLLPYVGITDKVFGLDLLLEGQGFRASHLKP